jgi:hypothetical protein
MNVRITMRTAQPQRANGLSWHAACGSGMMPMHISILATTAMMTTMMAAALLRWLLNMMRRSNGYAVARQTPVVVPALAMAVAVAVAVVAAVSVSAWHFFVVLR